MPELPEVEVTARLLDAAVPGRSDRELDVPGRQRPQDVRPDAAARAGRHDDHGRDAVAASCCSSISTRGLTVLVHLMNAGRLQLFEKRASMKDRTSRMLLRLDGDRELRLREFGTKQAAWVKIYRPEQLAADEHLADLGPEAWPDPPPLALTGSRPLHTQLRDQKVIAGIGRTWVDDILNVGGPVAVQARLRPVAGGGRRGCTRRSSARCRGPSRTTSEHWKLPLPDKQAKVARRPRPPGRAVPPLRDRAGSRLLRGLRDDLLPDGPDGRQGFERPASVAPFEVVPSHLGLVPSHPAMTAWGPCPNRADFVPPAPNRAG